MACKKLASDLKVLSRVNLNVVAPVAAPTLRQYSSRSDIEEVTHTGQIFDKDDYRNARFLGSKRYVNKNWGIKLIAEIPPKECKERVVWCDGGDEALGHPKVYINLDKPGPQACGYCGLTYVKKDGHH